ncbi:DUF4241 domain-containing protein [Clavibacter sp. CT19]|uniref:DUF4241 domain-containing protein n=1 Tax=Clavibacter sp. CT19 TaxID=3018990 RepID=UPI0022EB78C1|nr:DUF4241 domain-containing protein [Clavibacter sp. CT19]MDA3805441.1 DUF4241 domain-containing protein [Clavibacter sp. CT19]
MMRFLLKKAAEKRVQRFLSDYDAQWQKRASGFEAEVPGSGSRDAFGTWLALMEVVLEEHFTADTTESFSSFSRPPEYGVAAERIVRSEVVGETAYVLTECFKAGIEMFHEFTLVRDGARWRIRSIAQHFGDPTQPSASPAAVEEALARTAADAPWDPMPADQARLDENRNFTDREVTMPEEEETTEARVVEVGTLVTRSGALAVIDFGYDNDWAKPLARTVPPGSYPVDRVTGFGLNAALRVRFTDRVPVTWHPATRPDQGNVIGVDAGCVCIVDYPAYAQMTPRAKAAVFDEFQRAPRPAVMDVPLGADEVGIAAESGHGDGSCPVLWGVDADGVVAQLVVDFLVLVTEDDDEELVTL